MKLNDGDGAKELNRLEVLRGLRIATYEASFATVWATLTTGIFLVGFALWLGANNLVIGLVTAIPTFAGLIQIVSSYFGERMKSRKSITAWFSLLGRGLWLPILLLPIFLPRHLALYPFLILLTLSYIALNIPLPAYMSWMSDLVPPDHRGRYFGRRNMIAGIVGMALALPAAKFLDFTTRQHDYGRVGYGILFWSGNTRRYRLIRLSAKTTGATTPPCPTARRCPTGISGGYCLLQNALHRQKLHAPDAVQCDIWTRAKLRRAILHGLRSEEPECQLHPATGIRDNDEYC